MARETKTQIAERQEAIDHLRNVIERGQKVYTITRHTSRSGMLRHISVLIVDKDDRLCDVSCWASKAIGWGQGKVGGIKVTGCGMDMGFHLVYSLASVLFRDDPAPTEDERARCPKWQGVDPWLQRHGYALNQEWA